MMTQKDARHLIERWEPGDVISFFLSNGFSVIVENPNKMEPVSSTAISGTDATKRKFVCPLETIILGQIKSGRGK